MYGGMQSCTGRARIGGAKVSHAAGPTLLRSVPHRGLPFDELSPREPSKPVARSQVTNFPAMLNPGGTVNWETSWSYQGAEPSDTSALPTSASSTADRRISSLQSPRERTQCEQLRARLRPADLST